MRACLPFFLIFALIAQGTLSADSQSLSEKIKQLTRLTEDFRQPEPYEKFSGGATTSLQSLNQNAFSHPSRNMSFARELDFKIGNGFFKRLWISSPASTQAADGLAPLFNARSCQHCHLKDGRGHPPAANWPDDSAVSMFLRLSIPPQNESQKQLFATHQVSVIPDPTYGEQLQNLAIQGHKIEGRMQIEYEEIPLRLSRREMATLRKPTYAITDWGYGPPHPELLTSPRVAPPMIELGLLEAIILKGCQGLIISHHL